MVKSPRLRSAQGFTLIELLIIIGIIGFLASAILVAVDPVKRIQDARNAKRWSEVNGILNALLTKQVDDRALYNGETGALLIDDTTQVIVRAHAGVVCNAAGTKPNCPNAPTALATSADTACVANLSALAPTFIAELPLDPIGGTPTATYLPIGNTNTGYYISRAGSGRVEIGACYTDQTATIKVKR
jgi:type II secretory pathway pseudopilin PulG